MGFPGGDVFRPQAGLHAQNLFFLFRAESFFVAEGIECIAAFRADQSSPRVRRRLIVVFGIAHVEITVRAGRHDDRKAHPRRLVARAGAGPGHDAGGSLQVAIENFVPANHLLLMLGQNLFQPFGEINLGTAQTAELFFLDQGLDFRTILPEIMIDFIAADVDIGKGEEGG